MEGEHKSKILEINEKRAMELQSLNEDLGDRIKEHQVKMSKDYAEIQETIKNGRKQLEDEVIRLKEDDGKMKALFTSLEGQFDLKILELTKSNARGLDELRDRLENQSVTIGKIKIASIAIACFAVVSLVLSIIAVLR